jgi:hypothetical protein
MNDLCATHHGGNAESAAAFESLSHLERDRHIIWSTIAQAGPMGLTCDEAEQKLDIRHQSCSARITELKARGLLLIIGKRPTRSGRNAAVYIALLYHENEN